MPDASHDFGAHLRQAREQRGVSLREIAERTKISVLALEALERNDISRLPGGIFTRAFVRSYASEVGLDPEDTVRRFLARFPDELSDERSTYEPNPEHISVDEPPTFGRAWRAVAWSVPLLLVVGYFGFGGRLPWWDDPTPQPVGRTPSVPTPPPPSPAVQAPASAAVEIPPATVAAAVEQGAAPGSSLAPNADSLGQPGAAGAAAQPGASRPKDATPSTTTDAQPAPPPAAVPAATPAPSAGAFRLTLAPREACWVSVRSNGASLYSGLMRPGERQDLVLHGDVSLTVGNAGAFVYFINDQPGRALGGPGQVATVRLNADNAKTFVEPR
jgi:cytoskeletal protein RodZ